MLFNCISTFTHGRTSYIQGLTNFTAFICTPLHYILLKNKNTGIKVRVTRES